MKKKILVVSTVIIVLFLFLVIIRFTPKTFGKNLSYDDVAFIKVFDGNTGVGFTIENRDDIKYIVSNVQSIKMKKTGVSLLYEGYCLRINYLNEKGKNVIPEFIINSESTIRKDPFFFSCDGGLCFSYIKDLEEKFVS